MRSKLRIRVSVVLAWESPDLLDGTMRRRCCFWARRAGGAQLELAKRYAQEEGYAVHIFRTVRQAEEWMRGEWGGWPQTEGTR